MQRRPAFVMTIIIIIYLSPCRWLTTYVFVFMWCSSWVSLSSNVGAKLPAAMIDETQMILMAVTSQSLPHSLHSNRPQ